MGVPVGLLTAAQDGCLLHVWLTPKAAKCSVNGVIERPNQPPALRVSVAAVPEKGKANKAVLAYVAELFSIPKSSAELVSGQTHRLKVIKLPVPLTTAEGVIAELVSNT